MDNSCPSYLILILSSLKLFLFSRYVTSGFSAFVDFQPFFRMLIILEHYQLCCDDDDDGDGDDNDDDDHHHHKIPWIIVKDSRSSFDTQSIFPHRTEPQL